MGAAARILAERLPDLASHLGHERLWRLIFAAYEAKPTGPDTGIAAYWQQLGSRLPSTPVMWTTTGKWTTPESTFFLFSTEEDESIPVLEQLGVPVMHPQVGAFVRRMTGRAGARQLTIDVLAAALHSSGLTGPTPVTDAPPAMAAQTSRQLLWKEAERLLSRTTSSADRAALRRAALMPSTDGWLWPAEQLKRADPLTAQLITDIGLDVPLLDRTALPEDCERLTTQCTELDLPFVLTLLANRDGAQHLREALESARITASRILTWLHRYEQAILANRDLLVRVRALPIYPTGAGHRALSDVVLPGGFTDRLGIAEAVDREQVADHVAFLERIGAKPLTLSSYLTDFVPRAARHPGMLADRRWQRLVVDLAAQLDEFAEDVHVRQALTPLPLVACTDNVFRPASSCCFPSDVVSAVLGSDTSIARPVAGHERSTTSLYEWLGVAQEPRLPDVVTRVRQLAAGHQDPQARRAVAAVIGYLGRFVPERRTPLPDALKPLRDLAWLPVRGEPGWHRPAETHTAFRETLFATQGRFLDLPLKVQQDAANLLHQLGAQTNPTVSQVVAHLRTRVEQGTTVSHDVYVELDHNADDPAIERLIGTACLLLPDGGYVEPTGVFRQTNPFGRFRRLLGPDFNAIGRLLNRLGVKGTPDHEDARAVLIDIAREQQQRFHLPVEDDDLAVIWHCWQMLDDALTHHRIDTDWVSPLRNIPVIPNADGVLTAPNRLLIDDMPGVAAALHVGAAILRRKEGMWRAFQAAGVRSLTDAVEVEILQIQETTRDGDVRTRLHERRPALARVLDGASDGLLRLATALEDLSYPQTPVLQVRYHLPVFGVTSAETALKALYVPADPHANRAGMLVSCPQNDNTWPWMLIAKEFARALDPGETPGPLAASLYVALQAPSLDAAHRALDDAGWPRLEHVEITLPEPEPGARFDGHDTSTDWPDRAQPDPDGDDYSAADPADAGAAAQSDDTGRSTTAPPRNAAATADNQPADDAELQGLNGGGGPVGTGPYAGPGPASGNPAGRLGQPGGETSRAPQRPPVEHAPRRARRGRLRSYAMIDDAEGSNRTPVDQSPVDRAGVRRVVEFEQAAGRHPQVMSHNNPGFDVISRDNAGQIRRHIEVKSTSGPWDDLGVGLSHTQFTFAQGHRDTFWLYVVEHALDDHRARVLRIADPAGKTEEFRFDGGWAAASEDAPDDPPPPTGTRRVDSAPGVDWIPLRTLRDDLTTATQSDEWIEWCGAAAYPGAYALQVLGHALEPDVSCGALALVAPIARAPEEGELVVVLLRSGFDRDGRASATIRRWVAQTGDEAHQPGFVALKAAAENAIPPLYVDPSTVEVCGRVVMFSSEPVRSAQP